MSLKALHIIFVAFTSLASFFVSGLGFFTHLFIKGSMSSLALGIGGMLIGIALLIYGRLVLKKLRNISYL